MNCFSKRLIKCMNSESNDLVGVDKRSIYIGPCIPPYQEQKLIYIMKVFGIHA